MSDEARPRDAYASKNVRIVGKIFDIDEDLMNHIRNEHYGHDEEFSCEKCDFETNSASYLRKHIEIKHEIRCNQMHQASCIKFLCLFCDSCGKYEW